VINRLIIVFFVLSSSYCTAQTVYKNDTVYFGKFKGIIADSLYEPAASRNIFPKNRFKPTLAQVKEFEDSFIKQYANAIKKHHELFYQQSIAYDSNDRKQLLKYRDGSKDAAASLRELKKDYNEYDRFYYGYIGLNGMKYLRIEFVPHKETWDSIPGAGEALLHNLPPLAYNLFKHELSLAGWTGEHDE
jgi:hypothetical protein